MLHNCSFYLFFPFNPIFCIFGLGYTIFIEYTFFFPCNLKFPVTWIPKAVYFSRVHLIGSLDAHYNVSPLEGFPVLWLSVHILSMFLSPQKVTYVHAAKLLLVSTLIFLMSMNFRFKSFPTIMYDRCVLSLLIIDVANWVNCMTDVC